MKSLVRLSDYSKEDILKIFSIADELQNGKYANFLSGKTIVMFFPNSSIRTRVTFEKGVYLLGGQTILFPPETLEKKEEIRDMLGYLNNWADTLIVRHKNIQLIDKIKEYSGVPVINALSDINHPCEMIADLYSLSKIRNNFLEDNYLFCGGSGNIGLAWKEAAEVMNLSLLQYCPNGYEMEGVSFSADINSAIENKDIICTDSFPSEDMEAFKGCQITKSIMDKANDGAVLNPCPPFYRGEEVSNDVIDSHYFVGYSFKRYLLEIQQAIIIYNLTH